ncbi:fumarylacetoacetate hydrolase family protein [Hyphomonas johnsonii]|uniref:5-oxopent-3-ene-1,2,5-tricarboxylate decarboxylase n=1 Tax=Hyphomonas johnsonii MHS-2 TaxID=1280950 RepID=A0A059FBC9_9PROT|nr:fumarylacetoacetate hydrolase family protein [Hyphomonas johnsonii]KCZ87915.1 5-oxopent-3-ene-1,2,5-tricarboxylate decarboxylase [Hyphomonas johnsonii MHS-2]
MKLATFIHHDVQRIGIVVHDGLIDLSAAAPELPRDMIGFLEAGDAAMARARAISKKPDHLLALDAVALQAPVPRPGKVLGIGLNYADHVAESGRTPPEHQIWFNKQRESITGPGAEIVLPSVSPMLDYEVELCFIIGKSCRHVPKDRAHEVIAGFCIGNDVTVRDWQLRTPTMTIGKSFDTHGPLGPWLVTSDEVGDPHALDLKCWVNGELRQSSNTRHLIYDCYDQVSHLTQAFTLSPGDVIFSGTPGGVGMAQKPPRFLKTGDSVRLEIDKLGRLENCVAAETLEVRIDD